MKSSNNIDTQSRYSTHAQRGSKLATVQISSWSLLWTVFRNKVFGRKFVRDVSVLTLANGAVAVLSFMQGILVARWLGPELLGLAALVMSYPGLVHSFFDVRSAEASVKYLSQFHVRNERDRVLAMCQLGYLVDVAIAGCVFLVVVSSASWAAQHIAHRPDSSRLIVLYAMAFLPRALIGTSYAVLATLGRFSLIATVNILTTILRVALILSLVAAGWQVAGVVWGNAMAMVMTGLLHGGIAWGLMQRTWGALPVQGCWHALRGHRREIFRFLAYGDLSALLGMIPKQLDVILLGYFRNPTEVGYYKLARSLTSVVGYLVKPLQSVVYPKLVQLGSSGEQEVRSQRVQRLGPMVGFPLGIMVMASTLFIPVLLPLLAGHDYRAAVIATQLLLAGAAVWLAFFWVRPLFLARGWVKEWTGCMALFGLCNLLGWVVIVPKHGYVGMSAWWLLSTVGAYTIPPLLFLMRAYRDEQKRKLGHIH
jgi:O-antigen/teichoic acid export membrane protein